MLRILAFFLSLGAVAVIIMAIIWLVTTPQPAHFMAKVNFAKETIQFRYYDRRKTSDDLRYWIPIAKEGNGPAQILVAQRLYVLGQNNKVYYNHAVPFLTSAAEKGLPVAQNALGVAYRNGLGVEQNKVEAWKWFMLSARQGIELAKTNMASLGKQMSATDLEKAQNLVDAWLNSKS